MTQGRKFWDVTGVADTDTVVSPPISMSHSGDDFRTVFMQLHVNGGTGTEDLTGTFTVEVSSDPRVQDDIRNGYVGPSYASETALWTDITAQLTETTALSIAAGSEANGAISITFLGAAWMRLKFAGSAGTDGSIEAWESRISG